MAIGRRHSRFSGGTTLLTQWACPAPADGSIIRRCPIRNSSIPQRRSRSARSPVSLRWIFRQRSIPSRSFNGVAPLESAGAGDVAYMDNPKYLDALTRTRAGAGAALPRNFSAPSRRVRSCLSCQTPIPSTPQSSNASIRKQVLRGSAFGADGISPGSVVHPSARLEPRVTIDPGAVIGPGAEIGEGSVRRGQCGDRSACAHWSGLQHRAWSECIACLDRQSRDHPPGCSDRAGRLRFRHGARRSPQGPPDRSGDHPGRCRDRWQHYHRPGSKAATR